MQVGIFTDYPSLSVLSGPAIHTAFLKHNLEARGHDVTLFGPSTEPHSFSGHPGQHLFKGVSFPTHPKTKVVMPWPISNLLHPPQVDVIHGQINSPMMVYGNWMRKMWRIPMLNTHILHLPTHSHFLVGDRLYKQPWVRKKLAAEALAQEEAMARYCNGGDGLIVQSRFMVDYWRERGVTVPIEVVGRPINPEIFDRAPGKDPFPETFVKGKRLIMVARHDREKNLPDLLRIFDEHIAPADDEVTLTMVGDGAEHIHLMEQANASRYADRIYFPGELDHEQLVHWYGHSDLFVYTSVSETFGNVVNEALWCGLPCVAYDDHMGVAHQVTHEENGLLVDPEQLDAHGAFANAVFTLLRHDALRTQYSVQAAKRAHDRSHPDVIIDQFEAIYERAIQRCHDEIKTPLCEQSRARQLAELSKVSSHWAVKHGLILGVAEIATRTGLGRAPFTEAQKRTLQDGLNDTQRDALREAAE